MIRKFDTACLDLAIAEVEQSLQEGNYPVGAILTLNDKVVGYGKNTGETSKNYSHAQALLKNVADGNSSTLYSTLEPCLMCLGVAIMNKIDRIIYVQADPHAGACGVDRKSLGARYQATWPEIIHVAYSHEPKQLIIKFFHAQIANGIRVAWSQNFLRLIKNA